MVEMEGFVIHLCPLLNIFCDMQDIYICNIISNKCNLCQKLLKYYSLASNEFVKYCVTK